MSKTRNAAYLRGLGQRMEASLRLGKSGLTPTFYVELESQLASRELVKLRFVGAEREERAALCGRIAGEGRCECVGSVGHTALFYRANPDPALRRIELPE